MEATGDDLMRTLVLAGAGTGTLLLLLGGFLTRAAGHWLDGGRSVQLQQCGPLVWGHATVPGGQQRYRGLACFGWVRLRRRDHGKEHLMDMGFTEEQAGWMEGQLTGSLFLQRRDARLEGTFFGRRFSFGPRGITRIGRVEPLARAWVAAPAGAVQRA